MVGGGPAGLVAAIALAAAGADALLLAPPAVADNRTTALLSSSVTALETLGVWQACRPHAAPLEKMRIVDATRRLFRAPEVCFAAAEIGLDAFGYNIENRHLVAALEVRAAELKLKRISTPALAVTSDDAGVTIGTHSAKPGCGSPSGRTAETRSAERRPASARRGAAIRRPH